MAVQENNLTEVKNCIKFGYDVNEEDSNGMTPIHWAVKSDARLEIVKTLLHSGVNINQINFSEDTPLITACKSSSEMIVDFLLSYNGCAVDQRNYEGETALHAACMAGNLNIVNSLINANADINILDCSYQPPIFVAVAMAYTDVIKTLLNAGANIYLDDKEGNSILHVACGSNDTDTFNLIMEQLNTSKDIINQRTVKGFTPLMEAAALSNLHFVETLVNCGADTSIVNEHDLLALHIAAADEYVDNEKWLACFDFLFNNTPPHVIEEFSKFHCKHAFQPRSLPCFLLGRNLYERLSLLLDFGFSEDVISCPMMYDYNLYSPISFLLLYAEDVENEDLLKYLDLLLSKQELVNPHYQHPGAVSPLEAAVAIQNNREEYCIYLPVLRRILDKGGDPQDANLYTDNLLPDAFQKVIQYNCLPPYKLLLRHSSLNPEDFMRFIMFEVPLSKGSEVVDFIINSIVDSEDVFNFDGSFYEECPQSVVDLFQTNKKIFSERYMCNKKVPSLLRIARQVVRKLVKQSSDSNPKFFESITHLDIPKTLTEFLMYNDLCI